MVLSLCWVTLLSAVGRAAARMFWTVCATLSKAGIARTYVLDFSLYLMENGDVLWRILP